MFEQSEIGLDPDRLMLGGGALRREGYSAAALKIPRTVSLAPSGEACTVEEADDDRLVALGVARLAAAAIWPGRLDRLLRR